MEPSEPQSIRTASPLDLLRRHFGYNEFRAPQGEIIDHVMAGHHAMVIMPTGMGKSLCYQIPALAIEPDRRQIVLVLSPLIALMQDQVDSLRQRGIDAVLINSSLDRKTRLKRYAEVADGQYRLLYVTPERFRKRDFLEVIGSREVSLLAVRRKRTALASGDTIFVPIIQGWVRFAQIINEPTTIALTATATTECRADIDRQLNIEPDQIRLFHEGIERPNLQLTVQEVWGDTNKIDAIESTLRDPQYRGGGVIVYFSLIKTLERFSDMLLNRGMDHVVYHGDLPREKRRRIQDEFMSGRADVVLATNAFGMGVDKEDIRIVIHAETPGSVESYYQEIGRAGRDGHPSVCLWLYDQNDLMTQMQFIEWANPDAAFYSRVYTLLTERGEQCRAFGLDWMNDQLQRVSRHDHRLSTAIAMLDRAGTIAGPRPPECYQVQTPLPDRFTDDQQLSEKKRRDQQRLYAMVQYAAETGDRKEFLNHYFLD